MSLNWETKHILNHEKEQNFPLPTKVTGTSHELGLPSLHYCSLAGKKVLWLPDRSAFALSVHPVEGDALLPNPIRNSRRTLLLMKHTAICDVKKVSTAIRYILHDKGIFWQSPAGVNSQYQNVFFGLLSEGQIMIKRKAITYKEEKWNFNEKIIFSCIHMIMYVDMKGKT